MVVYSCHQFFWVGSQITWTYADCFVFKSSCSVSCSYHAITSSVLTIANRCQFIVRLQTNTQVNLVPFFTWYLSHKTGSDMLICEVCSGSAGRGWSDGFLTRHDFDQLTQAFKQLKQSHEQIPEHLRLLPRCVCRRWQTKCLTTTR